jgi:hypothetical protein
MDKENGSLNGTHTLGKRAGTEDTLNKISEAMVGGKAKGIQEWKMATRRKKKKKTNTTENMVGEKLENNGTNQSEVMEMDLQE